MKMVRLIPRNAKFFGSVAKAFSLLICSMYSMSALGQQSGATGIISGTIVDADFGGSVFNAKVLITELNETVTANMDGKYFFGNVPEGQYTLVSTAGYYKSVRVEDVQVAAGEVTKLDIPMYNDDSEVVELDAIVVKAAVLANSDIGLLAARQKAPAIGDAIGSDSFGKLGVGDAADALSKVTGVSISDGKYMIVRGLSDRYNNTTLNGSTVPSADPDKRAVQLDQFPSGIIESVVTTKSFTPDKSGSFAGGSVNVITKSIPDARFMSISAGLSYNEQVDSIDFLSTVGSDSDWLGSDDGIRAIPELALDPDNIPLPGSRDFDDAAANRLVAISKSFTPEMEPSRSSAPLNRSFSFSFGDRFHLTGDPEKMLLGVIGSLSYKRSYSGYDDGIVRRYEGSSIGVTNPIDFNEASSTDFAQWGAVFNTTLQVNNNHKIGIKSMYNQSGSDNATIRSGDFELAGSDFFQARLLQYTERTLNSYQLFGEHVIAGVEGLRIDWEASKSKSVQDEPDFRLFYDATPNIGRPTFQGNFPAPRRYWRRMDEENEEFSFDMTHQIPGSAHEIKFGFSSIDIHRDFNERLFTYVTRRSPEPYNGDVSTFLSDANLSLDSQGRVQRYIAESVGAVPEYFGDQTVDAMYLMLDIKPLENWRMILGARKEDAKIALQSFNFRGDPNSNDGNLSNDDWLPAFHIVREISGNQNIRLAFSKTLARPNFRELSPFGSFDNAGGEVFIGNPELVRSRIQNLDLRYEWFMDEGQLLATSAFYKKMDDPIESAFSEGQLTFANVEEATLYGLELEYRKKLPILRGENSSLTFGSNLTFTESEVNRTEQDLIRKRLRDPDISATRELQGQSAIVGNANLFWEQMKWGSSLSLVYNYTGERLYSVSDGDLSDIFEDPTHSLDFIYSQRLKNNFSMRLSFSNLLDEDKRKFLDDPDGELIYSLNGSGRSVSLSFTKRFE